MNFINSFINYLTGFFSAHSQYNPIIPPAVRAKMNQLGISDTEIIGAFNSPHIESSVAPNAVMGVANYYGRVVTATYRKDSKNPNEWVIIGCSLTEKNNRDLFTYRKYGGGRQ